MSERVSDSTITVDAVTLQNAQKGIRYVCNYLHLRLPQIYVIFNTCLRTSKITLEIADWRGRVSNFKQEGQVPEY